MSSCHSPKRWPALISTTSDEDEPCCSAINLIHVLPAEASFGSAPSFVRSHNDLLLENLVLRQQVAVLKRRKRRLKLGRVDKLFWVAVRRVWTEWSRSLVIVSPETVVRWHRAGFRIYWSWRSGCSTRCGRKSLAKWSGRALGWKLQA